MIETVFTFYVLQPDVKPQTCFLCGQITTDICRMPKNSERREEFLQLIQLSSQLDGERLEVGETYSKLYFV